MKHALIILLFPLLQGCTSWEGKELWINDYINITRPVSRHLSPQDRHEWAVENKLHSNYKHNVSRANSDRIWGNMHRVGASNFYMGVGGVGPWENERTLDPATGKFRNWIDQSEYLNK